MLNLLIVRSQNEQQVEIESSNYRELKLLSEIEDNPLVSQRQLSRRVGIALGLTNVLLRNFIQKGYIRASKASWKGWLYSVTPEGFSYKIRLTVNYIHRVLAHYQNVRQSLREQLEPLALNEESRVAIYRTGEFAELVYLALREIGIEEIGIFDADSRPNGKFLGMQVLDHSALRSEDFDRVVIATLNVSEQDHAELQKLNVIPEKLVFFFGNGKVREEV